MGHNANCYKFEEMSTVPAATRKKGKGIHVTREQKSILKDAFKFIPYPDHYPESLNKIAADTGLSQDTIKKWFKNRRKRMSPTESDKHEEVEETKPEEDTEAIAADKPSEVNEQSDKPEKLDEKPKVVSSTENCSDNINKPTETAEESVNQTPAENEGMVLDESPTSNINEIPEDVTDGPVEPEVTTDAEKEKGLDQESSEMTMEEKAAQYD